MHKSRRLIIALVLIGGALLALAAGQALANTGVPAQEARQPLHPTFPLLDADGNNVLDSGQPVSTMKTCGACHDTGFIAQHSFHTTVGLNDFGAPGSVDGGHAWDTSPGLFGKWNPLTYRYLTPAGDERLDLSTAEWIKVLGARHIGGGPATLSRDGIPLDLLSTAPGDPETSILDPQTGQSQPWGWKASGTVEMNCFLCHFPNPANEARIAALQRGNFAWANTATLLNSGIVQQNGDQLAWNPDAFDDNGHLKPEYIQVQDPTNENCALCHGTVHTDDTPLVTSACDLSDWETATTGQVFSGQKIDHSGMNLADKQSLNRSWDIHIERGLQCTECHYSLNNPAYYQEPESERPSHLVFDPRRLDISDYLVKPSHNFARGESTQVSVAPELKGTMRRCESCHSTANNHNWLPYKDRHMSEVACETCHIPQMYAPAIQMVDWTVIQPNGQPNQACRGIEGSDTVNDLVTGYTPTVLPHISVDGKTRLAPYNLIAAWYWVYGDPPRPVRQIDLQAAYLDGDHYRADVIAVFDQNGDGDLSAEELRLDTQEKVDHIAVNLQALGLENPRIQSEVQPYTISHNVTHGDFAVRDCQSCHQTNSRLSAPVELASYVPGDVMPRLMTDDRTSMPGELTRTGDGALIYQPQLEGMYIFGHSRYGWIDGLGILAFFGVLLGVVVHGGLRVAAALRMPHHTSELRKVYMYTVYERLWHWLQAFSILILLFTGLIIHNPARFTFVDFRAMVYTHNIIAAIMALNAFLAFFYHVVSGEIRQYVPRPRGFFDQAMMQAKYYLSGIFKGEPHPFEKMPERKLNPLQQATYFGLLNVLLPLQVLTGALMWGAQHWPQIVDRIGGLPLLAPIHSLIAWLLGAFVVMHIYLTTTGPKPLSAIQAMMNGWEEVEVEAEAEDTTSEEAKE